MWSGRKADFHLVCIYKAMAQMGQDLLTTAKSGTAKRSHSTLSLEDVLIFLLFWGSIFSITC